MQPIISSPEITSKENWALVTCFLERIFEGTPGAVGEKKKFGEDWQIYRWNNFEGYA